MNKFITVLGVAAVATFAGCKDPNYKPMGARSQNEVKTASAEQQPTEPKSVETTPTETKCTEAKSAETKSTETKPVEPEYTIYIVQKGDYLAKISKKYNITIASIKELNGLKSDKIRLGQKLKLPGKVDVGEQTMPEGAIAIKDGKTSKAKPFTPYTGETKEYTVKSGDTLGALAYGNGINIRQLKELNGLKTDNLKIGQKLKIPAAGKQSAAAPAKQPAKQPAVAEQQPVVPAEQQPVEQPVDATVDATPAETVEPPAAAAETTYIIQEGEDLMSVSIATGASLSALRELNNLPEDAKLTAGQVLKIPAEE